MRLNRLIPCRAFTLIELLVVIAIIAILAGFFFVQALNLVRIISLFYLGQWNHTVFEWFHLYLWPALIMLDVLVVFAIYLQWLGKQHPEVTPA